jgi:hypothetical protein
MTKRAIFLGALLVLVSALSVAQTPVPFINQPLVPTAIPPGGPQFTLTVNGTGFTSGSVVNWNGSGLATTFVSGSQLTAIVPAVNIVAAGTASVAVFTPGGGASQTTFFPVTRPTSTVRFESSSVRMDGGPLAGAVADLNGDGKPDIVISEIDKSNVAVLLGNGDGTFQPRVEYSVGLTGSSPDSVVVGDFNGDGKLDVAVREDQKPFLTLFLGKGDGTLGTAVNYAIESNGGQLVAADFNGDGKLDLATTNYYVQKISILLGNGDGTFQTHVDYDTGWGGPIPLAVGDVNGDGKLDIVTGNSYGGTYSVLLGNGDGTFQARKIHPTVRQPGIVTLADFDGDGILDLSIGGNPFDGRGVEILLGNGDGTFRNKKVLRTLCGSNYIGCGGAIADLNGDGYLDLVMNYPLAVQTALGNGDGTFEKAIQSPFEGNPGQPLIGDFNGDGRLDFFISAYNDDLGLVYLQPPLGPAVTLTTSEVNFGNQLVNVRSGPQTVGLTNSGTETLNISSIAITGSYVERSDCGPTLDPAKHCSINVVFLAPHLGEASGSLTITDDAPDSPQVVALHSVAVGVTVSPSTGINFTYQSVRTTSAPQTVTITNHFSHAVPIYELGIHGKNNLEFSEENTCGTNLAASASCTVSVRFTPLRRGPDQSTLFVRFRGGENQIGLTGFGGR